MRHLALAALAAAALLACPAAGSAQNYRATVVNQLDRAGGTIVQRGFRSSPDVFDRDVIVGALAQGASAMMELNLVAGVQYVIGGACDEDCSDLDLRIFAADNSSVLKKDTSDDDYPVLSFTAPRTGRYMLAADMAKCTASVCYYGYRVYRK